MLDYVRIVCAVPAVSVGDVKKNTRDICFYMGLADKNDADILVFPELALTGYSCQDLFFQDALHASVREGIREIATCSAALPYLTAVVGLPVRVGGKLYNCAAVFSHGQVIGIVPKTHIPNYGQFSEKRWFASGEELQDVWLKPEDIGLVGSEDYWSVPVKAGQLFDVGEGCLMGIEICHDLWTPQPPSAELTVGGAEVIVNLSASTELAGKHASRRDLVRHQSARCSCVYAYCGAGYTESTQEVVFSGRSLVAENGHILAENGHAVASDYFLAMDCDLGKIRAERMKNQSFSAPAGIRGQADLTVRDAYASKLRATGSLYPVVRRPFVPEDTAQRRERCLEIFRIQVAGLKQRLSVLGANAVVGVSGGLDSTLALLVAVEAMRQLGRPITDVHGVTMPCFGTSDRTCDNAWTLMQKLGISAKKIDIKAAVTQHYQDIGHDISVHNAVYENAQARERTQILMDYAGRVNGIVVGTGDLSELALGWCTYNGDHMSMYGVNASVPKTLIRDIIEAVAEDDSFVQARKVLGDIVATPISPELLPPDAAGQIVQQTEDIVGPYVLHDFFLYHMLHYGFAPAKIYALACRAFADAFDSSTIKKWLVVFYRRFFTQQFKRNCLPDGVKVGSVALSTRGDWRMPSDATGRLWLEEAEKL